MWNTDTNKILKTTIISCFILVSILALCALLTNGLTANAEEATDEATPATEAEAATTEEVEVQNDIEANEQIQIGFNLDLKEGCGNPRTVMTHKDEEIDFDITKDKVALESPVSVTTTNEGNCFTIALSSGDDTYTLKVFSPIGYKVDTESGEQTITTTQDFTIAFSKYSGTYKISVYTQESQISNVANIDIVLLRDDGSKVMTKKNQS